MYPDGHVLSNFAWFFGRGEANGRTTNDGVESHRSKFSQVQPARRQEISTFFFALPPKKRGV